MPRMQESKTKILIVGGGFAGTKAALELANNPHCEVTLVSNHDQFRYYPALYMAATGNKLAGSHIPFDSILLGLPVKFVKATVTKLDRKKKVVETEKGEKLPYDVLALALGNVTNYFGIKGLAEHSFGIKSDEEVERFRNHLHEQFIKNGCPDLNYIIVGGGATGIELAGALPRYLKQVMAKHGVKDCKLNITLVEAMPKLLPRSPDKVSKAIVKRLRRLGIDIRLNTAVSGADADKLMMGDTVLPSRTIVWTAGVTNHPFLKDNDFRMTKRGKVEVNEYLEAEPDIYVLGDNADTTYSGTAQNALHDGHFLAKHLERKLGNRPLKAYTDKAPILVTPVGPHWANVQWGKASYNGLIGYILRLAADLIGFHDIQTWPKAGAQFMTAMSDEDLNCPNCMKQVAPKTNK